MYADLGRGGVRLTAAAPLFHRPALDDHLQNVYHPKWSRLMMHEGQAGYPLPAASQVNDLLSALQGVGGQAVSSSGVNGKQGVVSEGQAYAMLSAGMRNDTALLKALTVGWQAQVQGVAGEHACGACCGVGDHQSAAQLCGRSASSLSGLCRRVPGTDMPAWSLPFDSEGSLGSATDGDEDAVTALIYLAELLDDDEVRRYAVASITAFVLEDLGLGDPSANSRPVPVAGDVPAGLQTIWLWRGGLDPNPNPNPFPNPNPNPDPNPRWQLLGWLRQVGHRIWCEQPEHVHCAGVFQSGPMAALCKVHLTALGSRPCRSLCDADCQCPPQQCHVGLQFAQPHLVQQWSGIKLVDPRRGLAVGRQTALRELGHAGGRLRGRCCANTLARRA